VVAHFLEGRAFEPAWDIPADSNEIRQAILDSERDGLVPADYHAASIWLAFCSKATTGGPASVSRKPWTAANSRRRCSRSRSQC
jgi:hypothetical protein